MFVNVYLIEDTCLLYLLVLELCTFNKTFDFIISHLGLTPAIHRDMQN